MCVSTTSGFTTRTATHSDWALVPHSHGYPTFSLASQNATLSFVLCLTCTNTWNLMQNIISITDGPAFVTDAQHQYGKTKELNPRCQQSKWYCWNWLETAEWSLFSLSLYMWEHIFACACVLVGLAAAPQKVGLRACYSSPCVWPPLAHKHKLAEGRLLWQKASLQTKPLNILSKSIKASWDWPRLIVCAWYYWGLQGQILVKIRDGIWYCPRRRKTKH